MSPEIGVRPDILANLPELNRNAFKVVEHYEGLKILGFEVPTPYFNASLGVGRVISIMREVGVGEEAIDKFYKEWNSKHGHGAGKGSPAEIEAAVKRLIEDRFPKIDAISPLGIHQLMVLNGIGVDCSGFVVNVLMKAFELTGLIKMFDDPLCWGGQKPDKMKMGTKLLKEYSKEIGFQEVGRLDLVFTSGHVGIVLLNKQTLTIVQSTPFAFPTPGIHHSSLKNDGIEPIFSFRPTFGKSWSKLYKSGDLSFRRLQLICN